MSDMYFDIPFRANDTPYNRGDLVAALAGGHVSLEQMRISPADGYAGVYLPPSLDLTPYIGEKIVIPDSAGKEASGYIKSIGGKAVNTIYAGGAVYGPSVADNNNIDNPTNNFAVFYKVRLADWTPSIVTYFVDKYGSDTKGIRFCVLTDGKLFVRITSTIAVTSTVATGLPDGAEPTIGFIITRETALAAGSVVFIVNGAQLGSAVSITAGATADIGNNLALYLANQPGSYRYEEVIHSCIMYNRAPSVADALSLYQNGIAEADKWGSQTALNTATIINHPATPYDTLDGASATGFHVIDDGGDTGVGRVNNNIVYTSGRKYRVSFDLVLTSGTAPSYGPTVSAGGAILTGATAQLAVAGANSYEFTAGASAPTGSFSWYNLSTATEYTISNIKIVLLGVTLALEKSGIGDTDWQDSSSNNLDALYPASGSAVVLFNNIVSTPGGSTYNWESIEAGFNDAESAGYTIEIEDILGNGHVYMCSTPGTSGSTLPVFSLTAGSTTADGGTVVWTECTPSGITWPGPPLIFSCAPKYGDYRRRKKYAQPISYSDGGDPYVYDKGLAARDIREIKFDRFLTADLTKLLEFIEIVRGAKFRFNFYDENGTAHTAMLLNSNDITSAPVAQGFEGEISLKLLFL